MSKLNILGVVKQIRSKSNAYLPIIEAIVNSIDSIKESGRTDGFVNVILQRENCIEVDSNFIAPIQSIEIVDNGQGFTQENRDSFDTFYSEMKLAKGGKGFGRFMFLKYFNNVHVESSYRDDSGFRKRTFDFGKQYEIVVNENDKPIEASDTETHLYLRNLLDEKYIDKGLETISRKILENLLVFFIDQTNPCPSITIIDEGTGESILLNDYISEGKDIVNKGSRDFEVSCEGDTQVRKFTAVTFQIFYANNQKSKIILTGHHREVTETPLAQYIPEFEDDFYVEETNGDNVIRRNYIVVSYVMGEYLDKSVSLERETFDFEKNKPTSYYPLSQSDIESATSGIVRDLFPEDVNVRENKKSERIKRYINDKAPWLRLYSSKLQLNTVPFNASEEQIDLALQKVKFKEESENRIAIKEILNDEGEFDANLSKLVSRITETGKNDLVHYVCTRREVLNLFKELLKRRADGTAELEKEIHNLIFPMGGTSETIPYENHNLWILDERLVFSDYVASDKKIAKKISPTEPDLVIFDKKQSFRNGDNEFSNPLTVFEFKRPKRTAYSDGEDPIAQIGGYVDEIRAGKYETPEGVERIKVNENTPVYGYLICDPCDRIDYFARLHQLTQSPDKEGYYGFHSGFKIYFEIVSFKRLLANSELRNKIFFNKLNIE